LVLLANRDLRNIAVGAGSRILRGLVQMLDGQMAIVSGPAGTTVTIYFPAPELETLQPPEITGLG
jgi:hypothetical protein